jgi:DNA-binding XRE family transcriptional regulator
VNSAGVTNSELTSAADGQDDCVASAWCIDEHRPLNSRLGRGAVGQGAAGPVQGRVVGREAALTERAERVAQLFGERLRELRDKLGETTRSLAAIAGMSYTYVNDLERGIKTPTLIVRLALALRCKVTDVVDVFNKHDLATLVPRC